MNFLALTIITEFDDYLFETLYDDPIYKLITEGETELGGKHRELSEITKIETTTSWYARFKVDGNKFGRTPNEEGEENEQNRRMTYSRTLTERDVSASWSTRTVFSNDK